MVLRLVSTYFDGSQPAFTCLKLTIETLEQVVNMFKVNNKNTRMTPMPAGTSTNCIKLETTHPEIRSILIFFRKGSGK